MIEGSERRADITAERAITTKPAFVVGQPSKQNEISVIPKGETKSAPECLYEVPGCA
jgi:hypothetical protein